MAVEWREPKLPRVGFRTVDIFPVGTSELDLESHLAPADLQRVAAQITRVPATVRAKRISGMECMRVHCQPQDRPFILAWLRIVLTRAGFTVQYAPGNCARVVPLNPTVRSTYYAQ